MLVDSHCHLDFKDFAEDLDAIVARAEAAGVGRIVTISTRVKRLASLLAIAERFPKAFSRVGPNPTEPDGEAAVPPAGRTDLPSLPKSVALAERGLALFT